LQPGFYFVRLNLCAQPQEPKSGLELRWKKGYLTNNKRSYFFCICFDQQVWAGPLSGKRVAVVLWNRCSEAINITADLELLGLGTSAQYSVRDLWSVSTSFDVFV
jgi:Alpha galactosidase C-terminal beta sandwich domain